MTLVDAGPLVALIDRDDEDHAVCLRALPGLGHPLITTWPAATEAMYLLGQRAGWEGQDLLWRLILRGDLHPVTLDDDGCRRARDLMEKYRDLPMDLADATLVALAETRGVRRVFTLDSDFQVYRLHGRQAFELVP